MQKWIKFSSSVQFYLILFYFDPKKSYILAIGNIHEGLQIYGQPFLFLSKIT